MSYFTHEFFGKTTLHGAGNARVVAYTVLLLPIHFETDLPFGTYPRPQVEGEIADVPVRGAWTPVGDGPGISSSRLRSGLRPVSMSATRLKCAFVLTMRTMSSFRDHCSLH